MTQSGNFGSSSSSEQIDLIHTVKDVDANGVAQVDIETTLTTSTGSPGAFTTPYVLDGYTVGPEGASDNNPQVINYDLEAGESVNQVLGADAGGAAGYARIYTYVGRETVTVNGDPLEACRVDSAIRNDADVPQFQLVTDLTEWYGVGSGLKLKSEGVGFPDSEQDRVTTTKVLTFGSINSVAIF